MGNCETITLSMHKEVIEKIKEDMKTQYRNKSNVVETILRKHYKLGPRYKNNNRKRL